MDPWRFSKEPTWKPVKNMEHDRKVDSLIVEFPGLFLDVEKHHETPVFCPGWAWGMDILVDWIQIREAMPLRLCFSLAAYVGECSHSYFVSEGIKLYKSLSRLVCQSALLV